MSKFKVGDRVHCLLKVEAPAFFIGHGTVKSVRDPADYGIYVVWDVDESRGVFPHKPSELELVPNGLDVMLREPFGD